MKKIYILYFFITYTISANAQLVINEFMASNAVTLQDEYGEFDDWIELYNDGTETIYLENYYITDDINDLLKYELPGTLTLGANSYLLLFADDNNSQGDLHTNFKLSKDGEMIVIAEVTSTDTIIIDSLTYSEQNTDISYGRYPDGNNYFLCFYEPTPAAANVSEDIEGIADPPDFSLEGGFYSGIQNIEIYTGMSDAEIRYTLDGSEPTATSPIYVTAISSDTTIVIKAKVFAENYVPSKTTGYTYFIDEHFVPYNISERLPVISISCDNDLLWSTDDGLLHPTNINNDWEYPAHIELYEPDGSNVINQKAGLSLFGHSTRRMEQKSFAVIARNIYGSNNFRYKLFGDRPFEEYKSFVIRNSGNDWALTYFRDAMCQQIVRNEMDIDAQSNVQAIIYINGEFYGICNIKEKVNEHYLEDHHNADPDDIDMLVDDQTLVYGDDEKYRELEYFMLANDMGNATLYNELGNMIDIEEYLNYKMTQIYIANIDMALNSKYWREKEKYGKWRWILYDTEISFGQGDYSYTDLYGTLPSSNTLEFATINYGGSGWPFLRPWSSEKFISILDNETFMNEFIQTFAAHINTTFKSARLLSIIDSMSINIQNEIPYQIETYGGHEVGFNPYGYHFTTVSEWEYYVEIMRDFARYRPEYMRSFITERFALEGIYELTLTANDNTWGSAFVQDVHIPFDSVGLYFQSVPLSIKAEPKEGYRFLHWTGTEGTDTLSKTITVELSENKTIQAVFEPEGDVMFTEIFYLAASEDDEFIEIFNPKHSTTVDLSNYVLSGDVDYTFPEPTPIGPREYFVIAANIDNHTTGDIRVYE